MQVVRAKKLLFQRQRVLMFWGGSKANWLRTRSRDLEIPGFCCLSDYLSRQICFIEVLSLNFRSCFVKLAGHRAGCDF